MERLLAAGGIDLINEQEVVSGACTSLEVRPRTLHCVFFFVVKFVFFAQHWARDWRALALTPVGGVAQLCTEL